MAEHMDDEHLIGETEKDSRSQQSHAAGSYAHYSSSGYIKKSIRLGEHHETGVHFQRRGIYATEKPTDRQKILTAECEKSAVEAGGVYCPEVQYSINKNKRWLIAEKLADVENLTDEKRVVKTIIMRTIPNATLDEGGNGRHITNRYVAYHGVRRTDVADPARRGEKFADEFVHRFGKKNAKTHYASLTTTPRAPRQRVNGYWQHVDELPADRLPPEDELEVTYTVNQYDESAKLWRKKVESALRSEKHFARAGRHAVKTRRIGLITDAELKRGEHEEVSSAQADAWPETPDEERKTFCPAPIELGDILKIKKKQNKTNKTAKIDPNVVTIDEFHRQVEAEDHAEMVRQLQLEQRQATASEASSSSDLSSYVVIDEDPFDVFPMRIDADSLDPANLRSNFPDDYYECSVLPRRFVIDITQANDDLDEASPSRNKTLLIFEVAMRSDENAAVNIWVNSESPSTQNDYNDRLRYISMTQDEDVYDVYALIDMLIGADASTDDSQDESMPAEESSKPEKKPVKSNYFADILANLVASVEVVGQDAQVLEHAQELKKIQEDMGLCAQRQHAGRIDRARQSRASSTAADCCGICFDEGFDALMALVPCLHAFCAACWTNHARMQTAIGTVPIACPAKNCKSIVDYDSLTSILPLIECANYGKQLADRHILNNPEIYMYCVNPACSKLLKIDDEDASDIILCECGSVWCKHCKDTPHWPVACEHAKTYVEQLKADGIYHTSFKDPIAGEKSVRVQKCPHCSLLFERAYGCNHIVCRCGTEFCYICGQRWDSGRHYNCLMSKARFTKVRLVDVMYNGKKGAFPASIYDKAVSYREKYQNKSYMRKLNESLTLLLGAYRKNSQSEIPGILKDFVKFYQQTYEFLEKFNIWIWFFEREPQTNKEKRMERKSIAKALQRIVNRFEFTFSRIDDSIMCGNIKPALDAVPYTEDLLSKIGTRIKKAKNM